MGNKLPYIHIIIISPKFQVSPFVKYGKMSDDGATYNTPLAGDKGIPTAMYAEQN